MTFEAKDFFGPGFWSNKETGVWGVGDQAISIFEIKIFSKTFQKLKISTQKYSSFDKWWLY